MQKRKILWIILAAVVILGTTAAVLTAFRGRRPFRDLNETEMISAQVCLSPPDKTLEILDRGELAAYLRDVVIYQRDDSYTEYAGQGVTFTWTMADGTQTTAVAFGSFLILNGVGYRTQYEPSEALNAYANRLLAEGDAPVVLEEPPWLAVVSDATSVGAMLGGYTWNHVTGDGTVATTAADDVSPADCREQLAALDTHGADAQLQFLEEPAEILSVRCWSDRDWRSADAASEEVAWQGNTIALKPGGWIYEVRARWELERGDGGTASYLFYVVRLEA